MDRDHRSFPDHSRSWGECGSFFSENTLMILSDRGSYFREWSGNTKSFSDHRALVYFSNIKAFLYYFSFKQRHNCNFGHKLITNSFKLHYWWEKHRNDRSSLCTKNIVSDRGSWKKWSNLSLTVWYKTVALFLLTLAHYLMYRKLIPFFYAL